MAKQADLIAYLFEGQPHLLSNPLVDWMAASPRFTAFVETYRDKIRKKLRLARGPENVLDLRAELEVAYCLLSDRRLEVQYEPYASEKRRGPDFAVTYRANLVFNIEVARIRSRQTSEVSGDLLCKLCLPTTSEVWDIEVARMRVGEDEVGGVDLQRKEERILRILLDKLGQMQPGMPNLLVIHTRVELARAIDLGRLMQAVKTRADGRDPAFYAASRRSSPAAFYKDFLHLSGILLWGPAPQLWVNQQARPTLAENVTRLVTSLAPCAKQAPID